MPLIKIFKDDRVLADKSFVADRFWRRFRGLMGKRTLGDREGLWFPRCNSIHMWGMSMPIDVVFLRKTTQDRIFEITSLHADVKAWKLVPLFDAQATDVFEASVGWIERSGLKIGDRLHVPFEDHRRT